MQIRQEDLYITEIIEVVSVIKKKYRRLISNYFNQCSKSKDRMQCWIGEKALAFFQDDVGVKRVYFYSADDDELISILSMLPKGAVIDYITKDINIGERIFLEASFQKHLEYGRFVYHPEASTMDKNLEVLQGDEKIAMELYDNSYGEVAKVEDAEEIDRQLREKFDIYEAHFYSLETLREYIRRGWVWVAKENGRIIAANLFEIQGKKCYGAYLYNYGSVEVLSGLIAKTNAALAKNGTTYYYCWMNLSNKRAIRYNTRNGYCADGVYDLIYVKR